MARTYKRDSRGRFASGGGGSGGRPAAKAAPRGTNRLTRDNSGRITSVGGDGATARGGRLRTASGKQRAVQTARIKGGGGRLRGGKGNAPQKATPSPAQVAGQRKRASETPEKAAKRRLEKVRFREGQLQDKKRQLETALNRRRGKLEGDERRKATTELRKTKISLDRISGARQQYENTVNRRQFERDWNMSRRSMRQAPVNARTARNRLDMLRRRVSFLRKDEPRMYEKGGAAYAGPKLAKAKKALSEAIFAVPGQRVSFRGKKQAASAQRRAAQRTLATGRTRGTMRNPAELQRSGTRSRISIGTSRQGNLLTGGFTRSRSGGPRPRSR